MDISPKKKGNDEQILEMLLDPHADLVSIAVVNGLTLLQFLNWANTPEITGALKGLRKLHRTRADLLAQEAASSAIKTLRGIADHHDHETRNTLSPTDPRSRAAAARQSETARKACGQLMRAAGADRPRHAARTSTRCHQSRRPKAEAHWCPPPQPTIAPLPPTRLWPARLTHSLAGAAPITVLPPLSRGAAEGCSPGREPRVPTAPSHQPPEGRHTPLSNHAPRAPLFDTTPSAILPHRPVPPSVDGGAMPGHSA